MFTKIQHILLFRLLFRPQTAFSELANREMQASSVFFRTSFWLGLIPPIFAYIGASLFGWRLGDVEPLFLAPDILLGISLAYFLTLLFGFVSTAYVSRWMAITYGATSSLGIHFALITTVGAPLILGSVIHLYPHAFINVLVFVPILIWSMVLLYRGLPIALKISPEQGMLMASSLIAYLLVAMVGLLGITVFLWSHGIGPPLGI